MQCLSVCLSLYFSTSLSGSTSASVNFVVSVVCQGKRAKPTNRKIQCLSVCLSAPLFLNVYVWVHLCLCDCQLYRFRLRRCLSLCLMIWANTLLTFWIHIHHQTFFKSASSAFCSARFIHDTVAIASAHPRH